MIDYNPLTRQWAEVKEQALHVFETVGDQSQWILGRYGRAFETALAARWNRPFAVGTGNGMDAIEIGLRCLGLTAGDKILTTPLSAFATTLAIVHLGAVPVFVDVDESGLLDLDLAEQALKTVKGIRAILPVHLYGQAMDLSRLEALRKEFGIFVLEDCAQSIDATFQGRRAGTAGDVAAVSFYPTKNLGAFGDAGALLTANADIAQQARQMRDYGQAEKYVHVRYGLNSRMDELQAALLHDVLLPHLSDWTWRRRQVAKKYLEGLDQPALQPLCRAPVESAVWHLFPLRVQGDRERLRKHLQAKGVETAVHYPHLIPDQPAMKGIPALVQGPLTQAQRISAQEVSLPIHPWMTAEEVDQVLEACHSWIP